MDSAQNVFRLLTGGASFDKKKYSKDVKLFEKTTPETSSVASDTSALNFFASKKRKTEEPKKIESQSNTSPQQKKQKQDDNTNAKVNKKKKKLEKLKEKEFEESIKVDDGVSLFKSSKPSLVKPETVDPNLDEETLEKQRNKHVETINAFRHQNHIKVTGDSVPDPIQHFNDLEKQYNIREYLIRNIKESGYENPTPIQMQALPTMLHGKEVLAVAPTGSGKTAAFVIPILAHLKEPKKVGFRAIIVSPTRELAIQIHREVEKLGKAKQWKSCVLTHLKHMTNAKSFDILVTTPMRLVQLVKDEATSLANVEWLIFDEADRLFDEHFIEQVDEIISACTSSERKVCLFSATMPPAIEELAKSVQKDSIRIVIGTKNTAASTINQQLLFVGNEEGKLFELRQMIRQGKMKPPVLIFVQSKERAQQLFHELIYDGINVDVMHADRTQSQRNASVEKFRSGDIWVLITTDLFSRGMDILGVNLVINYDFPQSTTSYIHRIGRTGRAGRVGEAITFYTEEDFVQLRSIANVMKQSGCENIPEWVLTSLSKGRKDKRKERETKPVQREDILQKPWEKKKKNQKGKKKQIKEGKKEENVVENDEE